MSDERERWNMLMLDSEGHGVATADAPWAQIHARGELSPTPTTGASSEPQREEKA